MIEQHERNRDEYLEHNNRTIYRSQVHPSRKNAIKIKDSFYIFTKIRVASIKYQD